MIYLILQLAFADALERCCMSDTRATACKLLKPHSSCPRGMSVVPSRACPEERQCVTDLYPEAYAASLKARPIAARAAGATITLAEYERLKRETAAYNAAQRKKLGYMSRRK